MSQSINFSFPVIDLDQLKYQFGSVIVSHTLGANCQAICTFLYRRFDFKYD